MNMAWHDPDLMVLTVWEIPLVSIFRAIVLQLDAQHSLQVEWWGLERAVGWSWCLIKS